MFINPSSLPLSSTVSVSETSSVTAYSFPVSLPLSTLPVSPPNQFLTLPLPYSSTMPPSGAFGLPHLLLQITDQPSSSVLSTLDVPASTTDTGTSGTSLAPSSPSSSNPGVSASPTSDLIPSGSILTPSSTILSTLFSTDSPSMPESTSIPLSTLPSPSTQSFTPASSDSIPSTSSPSPSPSAPVPVTTENPTDPATTVFVPATVVTSVQPLSTSLPHSPSTSTYTLTSIFVEQEGTTTIMVTSSMVLSTEPPGSALDSTVHISPGAIAAIVLGIVGAFAFAALWLFCARRRHRKLVRESALGLSANYASGPLDDEVPEDELGYSIGDTHGTGSLASRSTPAMEERYAGILAALHSSVGRGDEGGSTGGIYGSRHNTATDAEGDDDGTRTSSPTLPPQPLPSDDPPYPVLLSPPPPTSLVSYSQVAQPTLPPSAYYSSRRKSSPGPDTAWFSGHSVAPSYSSHYARSQTLGSGSGSGSVDALSRTRTGSEEPLLGIGKTTSEVMSTSAGVSPTTATDRGSNRLGLGSAFGSPAASMYSPSSAYPTLQHDSSGSYGARTASGSGSYGYTRSGTPSSFDVLRSVSSRGALSSTYSNGQSLGFKFGFSRPSSASSGSVGKMAGSIRQSLGVPPTSFRAWKDWSSMASDKEKQSVKEKEGREKARSTTSGSNSGSMDEKQGRGSPVVGVRALLGRLRLGGHTPSPHGSYKDLSSPTRASMDVDPEKAAANPPIEVEVATPQRQRFSFILSNPDPHPPSPYSGVGDVVVSLDSAPREALRPTQAKTPTCDFREATPVPLSSGALQPAMVFPTDRLAAAPSPVPTEESRLAEGLLHPRLRSQGYSDASLRDFEDYSRPIGGVVKNRLYSTTTFGTQDDGETKSQNQGTPMQDVMAGDEHGHEDDGNVFGATTPTGLFRDSWLGHDVPQERPL